MTPELDERYAVPEVPALDTERLTMRGHTLADFDECLAMWTDPVVMRHLGGRPLTMEEMWARLLRYAGSWSLLGFGYWVVRERATGRFVGEVGLADLRRDIEPRLGGVPEAGWVLGGRAPWVSPPRLLRGRSRAIAIRACFWKRRQAPAR